MRKILESSYLSIPKEEESISKKEGKEWLVWEQGKQEEEHQQVLNCSCQI